MRKHEPPAKTNGTLEVRREGGRIWSYLRHQWLVETPEERVRQEYLPVLVNEYGYSLGQMAEEMEITGRGAGHARADFVIWRSAQDKADQKNPLIIVECKSDNVTISPADYHQGDNYARIAHARFVVTHNTRETKYWRVVSDKMPGHLQEIENIPKADDSDKEIERLISRLKVFKENEFADLLHKCHNIIRNREKKDPAASFDEIAKILFVKVWVEREMRQRRQRQNRFTVEYLRDRLGENPLDQLFQQTKQAHRADRIFHDDEKINLKEATGEEIVRQLEVYNLSATSEDIKGIAFERFLGRTFRGEIGQFFTPRTIVEFMIRMVEPQEGDVICDPASGSGGFLIRFFEIVREQILASVDREYEAYRVQIEAATEYTPEQKAQLLRDKFDQLQKSIDQGRRSSRLWKLANRCIYGTDANDRMARTSKMNMIMHGDGHGGVHHRDGFLNVNGIFEGRFNIVLTNPPFGATVEESDRVLESDVTMSYEVEERYIEEYGAPYQAALERLRAAAFAKKRIAELFELPRGKQIKTEILFIERSLDLLQPGGRLGIVLPEGIFNNPSLAYVREFCEDRAYIRAIVSLPPETFYASGASVKASLLFMQKFTEEEQKDYQEMQAKAEAEIEAKHAPRVREVTERLEREIAAAKIARDSEGRQRAMKELKDYLKQEKARQKVEARALLKEHWSYPVFLYEAEKVGITATGEDDQNELYPNDNQPPDIEKTCLELYHEFKQYPQAFMIAGDAE